MLTFRETAKIGSDMGKFLLTLGGHSEDAMHVHGGCCFRIVAVWLIEGRPRGRRSDENLGPVIELGMAHYTLGFLVREANSLADVERAPKSGEHDSAMSEHLSSSWPAGCER